MATVAAAGYHTVSRHYHGTSNEESQVRTEIRWQAPPGSLAWSNICSGIYHWTGSSWIFITGECTTGTYQVFWANGGIEQCNKYGWNSGHSSPYHVDWHYHRGAECFR